MNSEVRLVCQLPDAFPAVDSEGNRLMLGFFPVLHGLQQNFHAALGHGADRLAHSGQLGNQILADWQTVHTNNGYILRQ